MIVLGIDFNPAETKVAVIDSNHPTHLITFQMQNRISDKPEAYTSLFHYERENAVTTININNKNKHFFVSASLPDHLCHPIKSPTLIEGGDVIYAYAILVYAIKESLRLFLAKYPLTQNPEVLRIGGKIFKPKNKQVIASTATIYADALKTALKAEYLKDLFKIDDKPPALNTYQNLVIAFLEKRFPETKNLGAIVLDLGMTTTRAYTLRPNTAEVYQPLLLNIKEIATHYLYNQCRELVRKTLGRDIYLSDFLVLNTLSLGQIHTFGDEKPLDLRQEISVLKRGYCRHLAHILKPYIETRQEGLGGVYIIGQGSEIIIDTMRTIIEKECIPSLAGKVIRLPCPTYVTALGAADAACMNSA